MSFFKGLQVSSKKSKETENEWLKELFESSLIDTILEEYISSCNILQGDGKASAKKPSRRFPNLAGFCRYLKIGTSDLTDLADSYPDAYQRILAVLEDEALNSELSTTLLGTYMKKRLNYEKSEEEYPMSTGISISFEHDIMKDGE